MTVGFGEERAPQYLVLLTAFAELVKYDVSMAVSLYDLEAIQGVESNGFPYYRDVFGNKYKISMFPAKEYFGTEVALQLVDSGDIFVYVGRYQLGGNMNA